MLKEQPSAISVTDQKAQIEQALSMLTQVFEGMATDAGTSEILYKMGLEDTLSRIVKQMIENPVEELYAGIRKMNNEFSGLQKIIINQFILLSIKNSSLSAAYLEKNDNNPLTYHLCLKENSLPNRGKIRKMLGAYNDNEMAEQFPVILHFIDEQMHSELKKQYSDSSLFETIEG
ncbi:MAG: hypothetical protein KAR19_03660 [Bacteroidales bacterium]|nr:hypothetical protein [Bacteroidales bacterium]